MANKSKSQHYWAIHRKVTQREWRNLNGSVRDIIAADAEHKTHTYKEFEKFVNSETERLYNDPEFYMNEPFTFRHSQFEDMVATIKAATPNN